MDPCHERIERAVDHLVALDERLTLERRAHDGHREVIAGAGRVRSGNPRAGECLRQVPADLLQGTRQRQPRLESPVHASRIGETVRPEVGRAVQTAVAVIGVEHEGGVLGPRVEDLEGEPHRGELRPLDVAGLPFFGCAHVEK